MDAVVKRIYLDTEPLIYSWWPHVSRDLENLLRIAVEHDVGIFIPEPVEREVEVSVRARPR